MSRAWNFSAGPAGLPEDVLRQAQAELLEYDDAGASIMELSHRGAAFKEVAETAERDLRELLAVPENYRVLFLQGGATQHFAQLPMNLAADGQRADYIITGLWGQKAAREAAPYAEVHIAASGEEGSFTAIPERARWQLGDDAAYVHYTPNETIHGVQFHEVPDVGDVPLLADMSSDILSRPLDVSRFGVIYAGAQKNIGPSGLVLMIVREDLLQRQPRPMAKIFRYAEQADAGSMLNTPNTFGWYLAGLTFKWLKRQGGLQAVGGHNQRKAQALYAAIDASGGFYRNPVTPSARSWMNVPFTLHDDALDRAFLEQSAAAGLLALKGHRSLGGMRASLYNAMPMQGVEALIAFMREFARRHG